MINRASDWSYFQKKNMLTELLRYLTEGNTDAAFTLWRRHLVSILVPIPHWRTVEPD